MRSGVTSRGGGGPNSVGRVGGGLSAVDQASSSEPHPLVVQARQLEAAGDHLKAVEQYLKVTPDGLDEGDSASPVDLCEHVWVHAADLATKFLAPANSAKVTELVASRLARLQVALLRITSVFSAVHMGS